MKLASILALAMLFSVSCKMDQEKTNDPVNDGGQVGEIKTPKERDLTAAEMVIGKRICSALKNKRELFETITNMQEQFSFRGEIKPCDLEFPNNVVTFNAVISNASSTDFEYVSSKSIYFRDVITDQTGIMKNLCDALASSSTVTNQYLSGSSYLRVALLIKDGYDRFEISKMSKNGSANYSLVSTEAVAVITQASQANKKFFGVEKERVRYTTCSNPKQFASTKQTWLEAKTPF